jgi:hypothetical protein
MAAHVPSSLSPPTRRALRSEYGNDRLPLDPHQADLPFISIVLTGRNDGYGGDFVSRFVRTLRFNHRQLVSRRIAHEIVFVEWAPPRDAPRLFDLVFDAIPELDRRVCAWYEVDRRYQDALSLNPRLAYLEFVAKNVGVRRAGGRFILTTNCDVFLGRAVLDTFEREALQPGVVYRAPRHDIDLADDRRDVDWTVLEDPRILAREVRPLKAPFFAGGTGDFLLLDRESFHLVRGFNEVYRAARFGVDRNFLVKALSSGLTIEEIGGPVYHATHGGSFRDNRHTYAGREQDAHWGNTRWHARGVIYANPPMWGLADAPVRAVDVRRSIVDFSWQAVPPLVDLMGVVLPVARRGRPFPGEYVSKF